MFSFIYIMFSFIYMMFSSIYMMFSCIYIMFSFIYILFSFIYIMFSFIYTMFSFLKVMFGFCQKCSVKTNLQFTIVWITQNFLYRHKIYGINLDHLCIEKSLIEIFLFFCNLFYIVFLFVIINKFSINVIAGPTSCF